MASVFSSNANEILRTNADKLESMSFDDLVAVMKGVGTIASRKPGAASLSTVQTNLTTASATVAE